MIGLKWCSRSKSKTSYIKEISLEVSRRWEHGVFSLPVIAGAAGAGAGRHVDWWVCVELSWALVVDWMFSYLGWL